MLLVYLGGSILLWSILTCCYHPRIPSSSLAPYEIAIEQEEDPYSVL